MQRPRLISLTWEEGRVFDRWMIVHFLCGLAGGFSNTIFGLPTSGVYALGVALLLTWEVVEHLKEVRESWENRVLDLVVGVGGISVAVWSMPRLSASTELLAFGFSTLATMAGGVLGGIAFRERERRATLEGATDGRAVTDDAKRSPTP